MIYLTESQIQPLLPMAAAIEQVERALVARAHGQAVDVPRRRTRMPGAHLNILQGGSLELDLVGFKAYYVLPTGKTSVVQLIDRRTGELQAIIESQWLGMVRTGAASAVAARHLALPDAGVLGMFGSGRQAGAQLEAICAVRPIRRAQVYSRDAQRLASFCDRMARRLDIEVVPARSPQDALGGAQIVVTITRGGRAVFDGGWLERGQLVCAAGVNALDRHEIDLATVRRADRIVVDARQTARLESGDLLAAAEAGLIDWDRLIELGDVAAGHADGRTDASQVLLFESHGMALQDLYCAAYVLGKARERGLGQSIESGYI